MRIISRTITLAGILAMPLSMQAQGELGFGETEDSMQSLAERVANIEQKFRAFNVYVNFNGNYHQQDDMPAGFQAKNLRLEMKGQIGDHFVYRVRQRLNKSTVPLADGLAPSNDYAMVGYRFNPKWLLAAGKMGQYFGGFEFDQNAIYVYQASDINDNANSSKIGVALTYNPTKTQTLVAQITNAYNDDLHTDFSGIVGDDVRASHNPFTYVGHWSGSFADGLYRTKTSYVHRHLAHEKGSDVLVIGQSINGNWGRVFLDYAYEHDDFDYMRFVSSDAMLINKPLLPLSDLSYHGIVARTDVKVGKHLILWAEGMYQTASCGSNEILNNYRRHYNYMAGLEFVPNPEYKIRYTLNYQGQYYDYSDLCGLKDRSVNRIEIGILCRIKCF